MFNSILSFYWYLEAMRKYFVFSGRSRRKEYWGFCLYHFLFVFILGKFAEFGFFDSLVLETTKEGTKTYLPCELFLWIHILPIIAVQVRRFHDIGKSAWWVFFLYLSALIFLILVIILMGILYFGSGISVSSSFANIAGMICDCIVTTALIILYGLSCFDSQVGTNKYGDDPKAEMQEKLETESEKEYNQ